MDTKKLKSLVLVAELGSISAAARAARLAQPAVSQHLRALENEFGAQLFERRRQGAEATEAGKIVVSRARQILSHLERAKSEVLEIQGNASGPVVLGLPTTVAATVSAKLIRRVALKYPNVKLRIVESMSGYLKEWVDNGRVDLAVLYEPSDPKIENNGEVLMIEDLFLVSSGRDTRFSASSTVNASSVPHLGLILPGRPHALRVLIDRFFASNDLDLNVHVELDATVAVRELVEEDLSYTILPFPPIEADVQSGKLQAHQIVAPKLQRTLVFCRSPQHAYSMAFKAVRDELVVILNELKETRNWVSWDIKTAQ